MKVSNRFRGYYLVYLYPEKTYLFKELYRGSHIKEPKKAGLFGYR